MVRTHGDGEECGERDSDVPESECQAAAPGSVEIASSLPALGRHAVIRRNRHALLDALMWATPIEMGAVPDLLAKNKARSIT